MTTRLRFEAMRRKNNNGIAPEVSCPILERAHQVITRRAQKLQLAGQRRGYARNATPITGKPCSKASCTLVRKRICQRLVNIDRGFFFKAAFNHRQN